MILIVDDDERMNPVFAADVVIVYHRDTHTFDVIKNKYGMTKYAISEEGITEYFVPSRQQGVEMNPRQEG